MVRNHVMDLGRREEVPDREDEALKHHRVSQVDVGQHQDLAQFADAIQHGPVAVPEAGFQPWMGQQRDKGLVEKAGAGTGENLGEGTGQTEQSLLQGEVHPNILCRAHAVDATGR